MYPVLVVAWVGAGWVTCPGPGLGGEGVPCPGYGWGCGYPVLFLARGHPGPAAGRGTPSALNRHTCDRISSRRAMYADGKNKVTVNSVLSVSIDLIK